MRDTTNEPSSAGMKPSISKPFTKLPINKNSNALSTKTNNPKVRMVIGSVSISSMGRTKRLSTPKHTATTTAVYKPLILMPDTTCFAINNPSTTARNRTTILFIPSHTTQNYNTCQYFMF